MQHGRPPVPIGIFPGNVQTPAIAFGNPLPVSAPAYPQPPSPPVGDMGAEYGIQSFRVWSPGETDQRQVLDVRKADALWRVSIAGNVTVAISYGTSHNRALLALQAPVVITIPGQMTVEATPRDDDGTTCVVTLTQATAGALAQARKYIDAAGALDPDAVRFVARVASVVTISGAAWNVPALSSVPLVTGSVLVSGSGFQEFEA